MISWSPQVSRHPTLRKQPENPYPSELFEDVVEHEMNWGHVEENVVGQHIMKCTNICLSKSTQNYQCGNRQWNCQIYRKRERKSLNVNFASEFSEDVADVRRRDMHQ